MSKSVSVTRALLIEVPKTLIWTFPLAFVLAMGIGLSIGVPILFGIEVDTDLKRFGL